MSLSILDTDTLILAPTSSTPALVCASTASMTTAAPWGRTTSANSDTRPFSTRKLIGPGMFHAEPSLDRRLEGVARVGCLSRGNELPGSLPEPSESARVDAIRIASLFRAVGPFIMGDHPKSCLELRIDPECAPDGRMKPMAKTSDYLALDLGAESGRGLLGRFDGERLALEEVHRFPNGPVRMLDTLHWDLPRLFDEIKTALRKAAARRDRARRRRRRHLGRRLRAGRPRRHAAGQPGPLPRRPDRRHDRGRLRAGPPRADLRDHRAAVPAVQHGLSAPGDRSGRTRRCWRWPRPC